MKKSIFTLSALGLVALAAAPLAVLAQQCPITCDPGKTCQIPKGFFPKGGTATTAVSSKVTTFVLPAPPATFNGWHCVLSQPKSGTTPGFLFGVGSTKTTPTETFSGGSTPVVGKGTSELLPGGTYISVKGPGATGVGGPIGSCVQLVCTPKVK